MGTEAELFPAVSGTSVHVMVAVKFVAPCRWTLDAPDQARFTLPLDTEVTVTGPRLIVSVAALLNVMPQRFETATVYVPVSTAPQPSTCSVEALAPLMAEPDPVGPSVSSTPSLLQR